MKNTLWILLAVVVGFALIMFLRPATSSTAAPKPGGSTDFGSIISSLGNAIGSIIKAFGSTSSAGSSANASSGSSTASSSGSSEDIGSSPVEL